MKRWKVPVALFHLIDSYSALSYCATGGLVGDFRGFVTGRQADLGLHRRCTKPELNRIFLTFRQSRKSSQQNRTQRIWRSLAMYEHWLREGWASIA